MAESIPQHSHCQICGKTIPITETLCSEECKQKYQAIYKKRKIMLYLMYGILAVLIIIFVLYGNV